MKKLKLLSLALALPLLALTNAQPTSAACAISLTINGTPYQACKGFAEHEDALAALSIPGFSYDKESHTIALNGFNGTISGECLGTCTDEIANTLPVIKITGDSIINNIAFQAGATTTVPTAESTTATAENTEATPATTGSTVTTEKIKEGIGETSNKTLCTESIFERLISKPISLVIITIILIGVAIIAIVIDRAVLKNKVKQTPSTPSVPQTPEN